MEDIMVFRESLLLNRMIFKVAWLSGESRFTVLAVRPFSLVLISAKNSRVTMKSFIVLSAVLVLAAGKFCPQEKNGDQCVAKE